MSESMIERMARPYFNREDNSGELRPYRGWRAEREAKWHCRISGVLWKIPEGRWA